jgi:predicted nucleic acid-binding protein
MLDSRVGFLPEPPNVEAALRTLTHSADASRRVWSDAYLAALASVAGLAVATLDQGFRAIKGVDVTVLED